MSFDDLWVGEYAFHAEDEISYPQMVRDEVKIIADQLVEMANLGVDPAELASPPRGRPVGMTCRAEAGSRPSPCRTADRHFSPWSR